MSSGGMTVRVGSGKIEILEDRRTIWQNDHFLVIEVRPRKGGRSFALTRHPQGDARPARLDNFSTCDQAVFTAELCTSEHEGSYKAEARHQARRAWQHVLAALEFAAYEVDAHRAPNT